MPHYSRIMTREIWLFSVHRFARASLVYYVFYLKYAIFITLSCAACRQPVYAQQIQLLIPIVTVIISSFFFNFNKPLINYVCMCVSRGWLRPRYIILWEFLPCPLLLVNTTYFDHVYPQLRMYKGKVLTNGTWMTDFTWLSVCMPDRGFLELGAIPCIFSFL